MKEIKELSEHIEEELEGAEEYIKCAIKYKDIEQELSKMYYELSNEEMKHVDTLHTQGTKLIKAYQDKGKTIPESMQSIYKYLHEKHMEKANKIKTYQAQYSK